MAHGGQIEPCLTLPCLDSLLQDEREGVRALTVSATKGREDRLPCQSAENPGLWCAIVPLMCSPPPPQKAVLLLGYICCSLIRLYMLFLGLPSNFLWLVPFGSSGDGGICRALFGIYERT